MSELWDHAAKATRLRTWRQGRLSGSSCIVTLHISSARGKALLQTVESNWPEEEWNCFRDSGYTSLESSLRKSPTSLNSELHALDRTKANKRKATTQAVSSRTRRHHDSTVTINSNDLVGHPEARGCYGCFQLGERCPLLDADAEYPCYVCSEDGCECELLIPPTRKNKCESCKQQSRVKCSYLLKDWGDHSQPCYQCASKNRRCVAGPSLDILRRRLPRFTTTDELEIETEQQSSASVPSELQASKTAQVHSEGIQVENKLSRTSNSSATIESSKSAHVSPLNRNANHQQRSTKFIVTKLAHPITFRYEAPANGTRPCQWCAEPFYGVLGREERTVEVHESRPGHYIEISGGHANDGCEPSRVCTYHTQEVFRIIGCDGHKLRQFRNSGPNDKEFEGALSRLLESKNGKALSQQDRWCSVCPQLASWDCSRKRAKYDPSTAASRHGCGLQLCNVCAVSLTQGYDNNLQRMLIDLQSTGPPRDFYPYGLRADVNFLAKDGPLVESVLAYLGGVQ